MSTTYHQAPAAYDHHAIHSYQSSIPHAGRSKVVSGVVEAGADSRSNSQHYRYPPQQNQPPQIPNTSQGRQDVTSATHISSGSSGRLTRPTTPAPETSLASSRDAAPARKGAESLIYHSLQIPKCISPNGGSLADFAAQMTCLFWFESVDELKKAETIQSTSNLPISRLPPLANPGEQFRKWVYTVLSTTQVTQNVVLLALLFIYRLKLSTPQIKGRGGSEYRLLTVALMLGNKFLDDNTYTNKTWAEVSCFGVNEIHVMEVEFLSNMRYNLLASKDEWEDWLAKLSCFHEYYDRASRIPALPTHNPSPSGNGFVSPMPSPTATAMSGFTEMPPYTPTATNNFSPTSRHSQNWSSYHNHPISPLASKPNMALPVSRKRSPEVDPTEHPAKRHMPPRLGLVPPSMNARQNGITDSTRLPVPHLTVVTTHAPNQAASFAPAGYAPQSPYAGQPAAAVYAAQSPYANAGVVSLPPLQNGMRAMSTVYQQPTSALHQATVPATTAMAVNAFPNNALSAHHTVGFGTPSKRHSPGTLAAYTSSPMVDHQFGAGSGIHTPVVHTPISHSPSIYLEQRNSPYKPIHHVNRLLYPPPSASLDQYHLAVPVQPTQMHYQPLGRRNDLRTGVVPEFVVYNQGQHQQSLTHGGPQGQFAP